MSTLEVLEIVNIVFGSLFYLIGIVMFIVVIVAVNKVKTKVSETAEMTQDAIYSVHELVTDTVQTTFMSAIINKIASFISRK